MPKRHWFQRAVTGPHLAELGMGICCHFVIIESIQKSHRGGFTIGNSEIPSDFSAVQDNAGCILQAGSQPSYQQQALLFCLCPLGSLFLLISVKACSWLLLAVYIPTAKCPFAVLLPLFPSLPAPHALHFSSVKLKDRTALPTSPKAGCHNHHKANRQCFALFLPGQGTKNCI